MVNIDDIFSERKEDTQVKLEYGKSLIDDINIWSKKFSNYLINSGISNNTILSYEFTLNTFKEYCIKYKSTSDGLCDIDYICCNDYLLWMENYKINKMYGSLKERIAILIDFIKYMQKENETDYINGRERYIETVKTEIKNINYVLDNFEDYYYSNEISFLSIDNHYITNYIETISKASVSTMMNRRAVLHKFLKYIEGETETDCFQKVFKNMKVYKKPKGTIKESKVLDEKVVKKLIAFIEEYTKNPSYLIGKRVKKNSLHVAYRNTAMILLMYGSGLRASEALGLRYKDVIDEDEKTYTINIIGGKGNKNRTTYIKKNIFEKHYKFLFKDKEKSDEIISLSKTGHPYDRRNLYKFTAKMFKKMEVDKKGLHIFRHHFGSSFAENDGNIKILQDLLGHYSINTTMIYSNTGEDAKKRAVAGI